MLKTVIRSYTCICALTIRFLNQLSHVLYNTCIIFVTRYIPGNQDLRNPSKNMFWRFFQCWQKAFKKPLKNLAAPLEMMQNPQKTFPSPPKIKKSPPQKHVYEFFAVTSHERGWCARSARPSFGSFSVPKPSKMSLGTICFKFLKGFSTF